MTFDEFVKKYLGKGVDYDKAFGVQCVDIIDQYLKDVFSITNIWVNGARDFYNNFNNWAVMKNNFERIANTPDLVVKKGDIIVLNDGDWGHIGIGTGKGDKSYFEMLEQNRKGLHEPCAKGTYYFNNCKCLGVLRPKDQTKVLGKTTTESTMVLDKTGFDMGDNTNGMLAVKEMLIIARNKKIIAQKVDENGIFGTGTKKAVNQLLKKWGYKETGIAGKNFIKKLASIIK